LRRSKQTVNARVFELPSVEDATDALIDMLRARPNRFGDNAYQYLMRNLCAQFAGQLGFPEQAEAVSRVLQEAAWSLCRLGVLRPGSAHEHFGEFGDMRGYAVTTFGQTWLAEHDTPAYIPTDPSRIVALLTRRADLFGGTYALRVNDAARCYSAHAYYACCAMIGAAAESILLAAAVIKLGEDEALRLYRGMSGRRTLTNAVLRNCAEHVSREFRLHVDLISLWRDLSAHADPGIISEQEAFANMRGLIKFTHFAEQRWAVLTGG
jgi:hypothetical protein